MSNVLQRIPEGMILRTQKLIEELISELRPYVKKIKDNNEKFRATFTDGSFVLSERRGAGIALFSSVSVKAEITRGVNILGKVTIDPANTLFIMIPRFALRTRASTIMRLLEYMTTLRLSDDVKYVFLDGSYLTTLLLPFSVISSTFYDIITSVEDEKEFAELISFLKKLSNFVHEVLTEIDVESFSFDEFTRIYYEASEKFLELSNDFRKDLRIPLQNYSFIFLEQNLAALFLSELLERSLKMGFSPIWISKDSESRFLAKEKGITSFSNDLTLMDFVLKKGEYLILSEILNLPPVSKEKVTVEKFEEMTRKSVYILLPETARKIYEKHSTYEVVYAKFGEYALQITYPRDLASAEEVVSDLSRMSSGRGYPEPMILVHNMTVLRERMAEIISDGLYEKCKEKPILCQLLSDSGRRKIGI